MITMPHVEKYVQRPEIPVWRIEPSGYREPYRSAHGAMRLVEWQSAALAALRGKPLAILQAPTGSGKSMAIRAIVAADALANPNRKVVIVVPQLLIAGSFGPVRLWVDGQVIEWAVDHNLATADGSPVKRLLAFLKAPAGDTIASRVAVCSHQTAVAAHAKLMSAPKPKKAPKPWHGVYLVIDEGHHAQSDEGTEESEAAHNRLGALVAYFAKVKPGPLLIVSATLFRANRLDIVPRSVAESFTRYTHTMEAFLKVSNIGVTFRFMLAPVEDALRVLATEPHRKTICYLPHVTSQEICGRGGKYAALWSYRNVLGKGVRQLDFVTEAGRDERKALLQAQIRKGGGKLTPDWLWALNLGKEGFDWPELERVVIIGARASLPDVIQMMGRALRPHGDKREVEITVILPHDPSAEPDTEQVRLYIKTIIASMVVEWPLRLPRIATGKAAEVEQRAMEKLQAEPQKSAKLAEHIVDAVIRNGDRTVNADAIVAEAVKASGIKLTGEEQQATVAPIREAFTGMVRAMMDDARDLPFDVDVSESLQEAVRILGARFGYRTLGELREAVGDSRLPIVPADVLRGLIQGVTTIQYMDRRHDIAPGFTAPAQSEFKRLYGMTFQELRSGARRGSWVSEATLRARIAGINCDEYELARRTWGTQFPGIGEFSRIYGKSFAELRDGVRSFGRRQLATIEELRARIKGMTQYEYNEQRKTWGTQFVSYENFARIYGMTFTQIRDGIRGDARVQYKDEPTVRATVVGRTQREYDKIAASSGRGWPRSFQFKQLYGKTFAQIRDGK